MWGIVLVGSPRNGNRPGRLEVMGSDGVRRDHVIVQPYGTAKEMHVWR